MTPHQPLFYCEGKTIFKRAVEEKRGAETVLIPGFPVCTMADGVDEKSFCQFMNDNAR